MDMTYSVLIAEDDLQWQKLLCHALSHTPDLQVVGTASNGQDALQQIHLLLPQIILLDLVMPQMNGEEILRHIRTEMPNYHPIILVVTNFGGSTMVRNIGNLDVDSYILRPIRLNVLLDIIRSHLPSQRMTEQISTVPEEVLQELGISPCRRYYACTLQAIRLCIHNPLLTEHVSKQLYYLTAERCHSTPAAVEHAIRSCHTAARRCHTPLYQHLFEMYTTGHRGNVMFLTLLTQECLSRLHNSHHCDSNSILSRKLVLS